MNSASSTEYCTDISWEQLQMLSLFGPKIKYNCMFELTIYIKTHKMYPDCIFA